MKKMLFALVMVSSMMAQAALLSYEAGFKSINGVSIKKSASINDRNNQPTALKMDVLGAGLRAKTVLVVKANVYVAQLFSDNKAGYVRDANQALSSLVKNSNRVALKIDMLRTVSASALVTSFKEALAANKITLDAELNSALALMEKSAEATSGKTITLLMTKDNGKTNLYYEPTVGDAVSMVGSAEMMGKIMAIWLGVPADDGLATLKADLLKPVY